MESWTIPEICELPADWAKTMAEKSEATNKTFEKNILVPFKIFISMTAAQKGVKAVHSPTEVGFLTV